MNRLDGKNHYFSSTGHELERRKSLSLNIRSKIQKLMHRNDQTETKKHDF